MTRVVKVGGARLEDLSSLDDVLSPYRDRPLAIVHGGGRQITRQMEKAGIRSAFIDGLRVTGPAELEAVRQALIGEVLPSIVATLRANGWPACGLFGAVQASVKDGPWGLVGDRLSVDAGVVRAVLSTGGVPVIPTLALGPQSLLNVNGDETAAAVAAALKAEELVFITDVAGVMGQDGAVLERIANPASLLHKDFVTGGMRPKLRSVAAAMSAGVLRVRVGQTQFGAEAATEPDAG